MKIKYLLLIFAIQFCGLSVTAQPALFLYPENVTTINDLAQNGDTLWLATDSGIVRLHVVTQAKQYFFGQHLGNNNKFNRILIKNNIVWAASSLNGLWKYAGGTWTNYTTQHGLTSNEVLDLTFTKDSTLWIATNAGLTENKGSQFSAHLPFTDNNISAIASHGDSLIAGNGAANESVKLYYNGTWLALPSGNLSQDNALQLFIDENGSIYKSSFSGFQELSSTTWTFPTNTYGPHIISEEGKLPLLAYNNPISSILKTPQGWTENPDYLQFGISTLSANITALHRTSETSFWSALRVNYQTVLAHCFILPNQPGNDELSVNALRANFWADGKHFNNGTLTDTNLALSYKNKSLVYSSFLKMTGWTGSKLNRITTNQNYANEGIATFIFGPVSMQRHKKSFYEKYYNVWHVTKNQVETHKASYQSPNYNAPDDLLNWPGNGDVSQGESQFIAPFVDLNFNGIYEPMQGDYPDILGDEAVFFVFNSEQGFALPGHNNIHAEFHTLAYAFDSAGTPAHHSIFINQKIIFSNQSFDTLLLGQFIDYDLGNSTDDLTGCDSTRNLSFTYNGDADDNGNLGFGTNPPAAGFLMINHPLAGFVGESTKPTSNLFPDLETFNTLNSLWADGSPIRIESPSGIWNNQNGDGQNASLTDPITKFQFNAEDQWYQYNKILQDVRTHSMQRFTNIVPGTELCLSYAYIMAKDSSWTDISSTLSNLYANENWIQTFYNNTDVECLGNAMALKEEKETSNWKISPNPSRGIFNISTSNPFGKAQVSVINTSGQLVWQQKTEQQTTQINLSHLPQGIYILQIFKGGTRLATERLVLVH